MLYSNVISTRRILRFYLPFLLSATVALPAFSADSDLPEISKGHPRLLATAADIADLKAIVDQGGLFEAKNNLLNWVNNFEIGLKNCTQDPSVAYCNVTKGGRDPITSSAKNIVMAHKLTGEYYQLAKCYVDYMIEHTGNARGVGGESSMGARIAAYGFIYDWLYEDFRNDSAEGAAYLQKIRTEIVQTILTDIDGTGDLMGYICDGEIKETDTELKCTKPVDYKTRTDPSIADGYLGGHHATASANTLTALLAIADEYPRSRPLMQVIYDHFKEIVAARAYVSAEGGHHMGYGYNAASADFGDRLVLWRKGFVQPAPPEKPMFWGEWQSKMIYPFIYGLRADGFFPASGDNYVFQPKMLSSLALHAAVTGNNGDAKYFYNNHIVPNRDDSSKRTPLWDTLLYPHNIAASTSLPSELARHFGRSGQVLMRDTWNKNNATILEFKSSNFLSINHQHLDQNSISLFYKEPLLLDSGLYDSYGSRHWRNYYIRTVAHNTITVLDPIEPVTYSDKDVVNDGGQWFHGKQQLNPLLSEIQQPTAGADPLNWLDGVTRFENRSGFAYAVGNASKAYWAEKMEQTNGFIREVMYLRPRHAISPDAPEIQPVVIVFDKVRTRKGLKARSLLHFASKPVADVAPDETINAGVYDFQFPVGAQRAFTSRGSKAMITTEVLLPATGQVQLIGGEGTCPNQAPDPEKTSGPQDCRYLVYSVPQNGTTGSWVNFPARAAGENVNSKDGGLWRIEIEAEPDDNNDQRFLTVLSVKDTDGRNCVTDSDNRGCVAQITSARSLAGAPDANGKVNVEAVQIGTDRTVLFNRGSSPATIYRWNGPVTNQVIATGLTLGKRYAITWGTGNQPNVLAEAAGGVAVSEKGVAVFERP